MTSYKTTAEYTTELIMDENSVGVQKFLGERSSLRSIAADMEEVYGINPEIIRLGSLDELYAKMHAVKQEGNSMTWKDMFYQYYTTNGLAHLGYIETLDNQKYPRVVPETLKDFSGRVPVEKPNDAYVELGVSA